MNGYEKAKEAFLMAGNEIERLRQENKQLKETIKNVDDFCDRYMNVNLELFDMYGLLNKIREMLGDNNE